MADVVIIGGGVIGLMCARAFAEEGAAVTVLEQQKIGQESSWAGGGILSPLYPWRQADAISHLALRGQHLYQQMTLELITDNNCDPEQENCGLLVHDIDDMETALQWCDRFNQSFSSLNAEQISQKLPPCQLKPSDNLWFSDIGHIRNPRLIKALLADLNRRKVRLFEHHPVDKICHTKSRVTSVKSRQLEFSADHYVFACGAWSSLILREIAPTVKVRPIQGQMLIYQTKPGTLPSMVLTDGRYLIPRRDGKILVGSTVADKGFDKTPDSRALAELTTFAGEIFPALKSQKPVYHWAGLRPGTDSGIPYIDTHPELQNLAINCGHFRNGLVMAPAAAELTVDLLLQRPTAVTASPYQLGSPH